MMHHLDTSIKSTQATNAALNQRLEEALKSNGELEATIQDLQTRLREATEQENVRMSPQDAAKELKDCKRSLAYMLSPSMADWREAEKEPTEVEKVRPRRLSEPPRPDVACDKWKADNEGIEGIHAWLKEGLPPVTREARLKIELTEGLPEFKNVITRYGLRYGLTYILP
eukprot:symbB.v1.2.011484.t1/scaffold766.1/size164214/9